MFLFIQLFSESTRQSTRGLRCALMNHFKFPPGTFSLFVPVFSQVTCISFTFWYFHLSVQICHSHTMKKNTCYVFFVLGLFFNLEFFILMPVSFLKNTNLKRVIGQICGFQKDHFQLKDRGNCCRAGFHFFTLQTLKVSLLQIFRTSGVGVF